MDLHKMMNILQRAQNTYGYANQVSVAAEECCELAMVCNKYIRYPDHDTALEKLRPKIVEEVADVCIVLQHLFMIFNIDQGELDDEMWRKLDRLERWMNTSDNLYQSTVDREVKPHETKGL